jgi:hypothetical protein
LFTVRSIIRLSYALGWGYHRNGTPSRLHRISSLGLTEDKVDAEGVLQLHLEHLTASWARNDGSA